MKNTRVLAAAFSVLLALPLSKSPAHEVIDDMANAATNFLNSLSDEQKAKAVFEFDSKVREDWHFIPKERVGLPLKEMRTEQRQLGQALLSTAMSHDGYVKALTIMSLERVLWEMENHAEKRDPEKYHWSIFGTPSTTKTWGWRVEGHHLSINFTIINGKHIIGTPSFFGANPGNVPDGPRKGLRVLGVEEDLGRALVKSLNAEQSKQAIYDTRAPDDVLTSADTKVSPLEEKGIRGKDLDEAQRKQLHLIIEEYVKRHRPLLADEYLGKIDDAGLDDVQFAWSGSTELGQGHYYRVQGKTFLMEYDNTQNGANHPHAVWRDFDGDFGRDLLKEHYEKVPHGE